MNVLIAGDFAPLKRVENFFEKKIYSEVLGNVKTIIEQADFSIVNLEAPVIYGEPTPIKKTGPNLSCTENAVEGLKWAGFDCVTLANNHFYDQGELGVDGTLMACEKYAMSHVGAGKCLKNAENVLYKEIGQCVLAVINCCEHEWSIASDTQGGSNPINPVKQYYAIREAKKKADYVLVIVHGGIELYRYPTPRMQEIFRFFVDAGADAVVNHHQHCYSGYEVYNGKPIFYGLGNFCFDKNDGNDGLWNYGYLLELGFTEKITFKVLPYRQCAEQPKVELLDSNYFKAEIELINQIILKEKGLSTQWNNYVNHGDIAYIDILEPIHGRLFGALKRLHLMPSLVSSRGLYLIKGNVQCESHRERFMNAIDRKIRR